MEVKTVRYNSTDASWSGPLPPLDSPDTLVLVFGAPEMQNRGNVFQELRQQYPQSRLVGCSTAGEVLGNETTVGALVVAVMKFSVTRIMTSAIVVRQKQQSQDAAKALARKLLQQGMPSAVLFLGDGVLTDQRGVVTGLRDILGPKVPIVGTFAGDGERYERPWVLVGNRLQSGLCAAIAFYGDTVSMTCSTSSDWGQKPTTEHTVTKADGNIIYEIDGAPALELCRKSGALLPLMLADGSDATHFTPLWADDAQSAVAYHRHLAEGTKVAVLDPSADTLIQGAGTAAKSVSKSEVANLGENIDGTLALLFVSLGHRLFLGERAGEELSAVAEHVPRDAPLVGLYSYGNAVPVGAKTVVSNSGLSLVLLSEREGEATVTRGVGQDPQEHATRAIPPEDTSLSGSSGSVSATGSNTRLSSVSMSQTPSGQSIATASEASIFAYKPIEKVFGGVRATIYRLPELTLLVLQGELNESFNSEGLGKYMMGRVVLDLGGIEQITSFGVRGWLELMGNSRHSELYLASCSEVIVNQMLMVRNFSGGGYIASFGAPYLCTACSNSFEFSLETASMLADGPPINPPDIACSDCGGRAVFDDDPESFFEFLGSTSAVTLPTDVRTALADRKLASMTQVDEAIEMQVQGNRTNFRVNRSVDEKIRWQRVLQGVEGIVQLDFSSSRDATDLGVERMLTALRKASEQADEILLDQVNVKVIEWLEGVEPIPNTRVRSVTIKASCTNCGLDRLAGIDAAQIREAKERKVQAETECRRCSASIPLIIPDYVVSYITGSSGRTSGRAGGLSKNTIIGIAALMVVLIALAILVILK